MRRLVGALLPGVDGEGGDEGGVVAVAAAAAAAGETEAESAAASASMVSTSSWSNASRSAAVDGAPLGVRLASPAVLLLSPSPAVDPLVALSLALIFSSSFVKAPVNKIKS